MAVINRKKTCPKCGRHLWLRDFWQRKDGTRYSYCKECSRAIKNAEYARNRKKPDGIFLDRRTGRAVEHRGCSVRIHWSGYMIERLTRFYATTKNEDLALNLGVSPRTMIRKARELGLEKSKEWMAAHSRANCKTMAILNKCCGNSGQFKKGVRASPATEFKKRTVKI